MTESEWLKSEDPAAVLRFVMTNRGDESGGAVYPKTMLPAPFIVSDRKLRLFAVACCRQVPHLLDDYSRQLVRDVERVADGERIDLSTRYRPDWPDCYLVGERADWIALHFAAGERDGDEPEEVILPSPVRAALIRDIAGNPWRPVVLPNRKDCPACGGAGSFLLGSGEDAERVRCQCCPWLTPVVRTLARAAYEDRLPGGWRCVRCGPVPANEVYEAEGGGHGHAPKRGDCWRAAVHDATGCLDPARLAVLSDALEEAGLCGEPCPTCGGTGLVEQDHPWGDTWVKETISCCCETGFVPHPILAHLRSEGPHFRGMWSLDVVLGKK